MTERGTRILSCNGHLGFGKTREASFLRALDHGVDYLISDAGSCDIGPGALGSDGYVSPTEWVRHDLELMLLAARERNLPMIIGSAGDAGSRAGVDRFVEIIRDLAAEHELPEFTIGYFYSDVEPAALGAAISRGMTLDGLDDGQPLTLADVAATDRAVAVAGAEPYVELLEMGADVIIGGRSSDCAIFAAAALHEGHPADLAFYLGKVLECASFCAEPYGGKESVIGEVGPDWVDVTAMAEEQRCTPASLASHAMYERSHPYYEAFAGGVIDMTECAYEQIAEKTTRVTGSKVVPSPDYRVKIEGAGGIGARYIGLAGIRDPYTLANLDQVIGWARDQVEATFGTDGYELHFHVYGRDAVLKDREPDPVPGHEVGVVVDATDPDPARAEEICMTATRQLFYARLPEVKGTAGGVAYLFDEVLRASDAYRWTISHLLPVDDWRELFTPHLTTSTRNGT
ncbi:MAG TPA: acyclic terpene utilization AtuA family protein [Acidimicrobiia bacterium]|nr:acyclic terpene utilization AtuA family protein [Acidimicrobiia bacterium]